MSDDHVLGIAYERGNAPDIRTGRERDQIRQHRQFSAPNHRDKKRGQHHANRVIDEQGGKNSRRQRDIEQQSCRRVRKLQYRVRRPFKEMREVKIGGDEHHRE